MIVEDLTLQPLRSMNGTRLGHAFWGGVVALSRQASHLDRINVFPVADGDTGTNLSMTLQHLRTPLEQAPAHAGQLLMRLADAALDGARGNSGAIFAQFLCGLSDYAQELSELNVTQTAEAWLQGANAARLAVSHPQPGTMLSVFEGLGIFFKQHSADTSCLRSFWKSGVIEAQRIVEATRGTLEPMRKANVVDAGALGVLAFIEGIAAALESDAPIKQEPTAIESAHGPIEHAEGGERFCTECLIAGTNIDHRLLRETLSTMGSSLVVAGTQSKVRLHIHTDDPAAVFREAKQFGSLTETKADDMQRQTLSARRSEAQVAIVMDSAGDLPEEIIAQYHIHVVPLRVHFGEESFIDKVGLSQADFYDRLQHSAIAPKTSQPAVGDFRRCFEYLSSHHPGVVGITVTAKASGTHQSAVSATHRLSDSRAVTIIDSLNASVGQGLLALTAAEKASEGVDLISVVQAVEKMRPVTRTWAYLPTLDHAVRGGRVPGFARTISRWLGLNLLLTAHGDGRIGLGGVLWNRRRPLDAFISFICRQLDPEMDYRLLIGHGFALDEAHYVKAGIARNRPRTQCIGITPTGAALGVHGGPGFLVVSAQPIQATQELFER